MIFVSKDTQLEALYKRCKMNKVMKYVLFLAVVGIIPGSGFQANAADSNLLQRNAWPGHDNCKGSVMILSKQRVSKNGQDMVDEPLIVFVTEDISVPCLKGPEAAEDLRRSFLYFIEENYPEKALSLHSRIDMQSNIWSLPGSEVRYARQRDDYSEHATLSLKPRGYEITNVSNFEYVPGTFADRQDRRSEHQRMFRTYIKKDNKVEY